MRETFVPRTIEIKVLCKCGEEGVLEIDPYMEPDWIYFQFWVRHEDKMCDFGFKRLKGLRMLGWRTLPTQQREVDIEWVDIERVVPSEQE